jgi:hypothetical protein
MRLTSKEWNQLANNDFIWHDACLRQITEGNSTDHLHDIMSLVSYQILTRSLTYQFNEKGLAKLEAGLYSCSQQISYNYPSIAYTLTEYFKEHYHNVLNAVTVLFTYKFTHHSGCQYFSD